MSTLDNLYNALTKKAQTANKDITREIVTFGGQVFHFDVAAKADGGEYKSASIGSPLI